MKNPPSLPPNGFHFHMNEIQIQIQKEIPHSLTPTPLSVSLSLSLSLSLQWPPIPTASWLHPPRPHRTSRPLPHPCLAGTTSSLSHSTTLPVSRPTTGCKRRQWLSERKYRSQRSWPSVDSPTARAHC